MTRAWRFPLGFLYLALLLVALALGLGVMIQGYTPVPFADFWAQFPLIEEALRGHIDPAGLWAQWNEHRIPLARLQFIVDYGLFDGTNVFLFAAIAATCVALAVLFALTVWRETGDLLLALGMLATGVAATLSPAGIENLTWAFQVAFVQVFLFAAVAILAVVSAARSSTAGRGALGASIAALAAAAATYSLANGLLTWLVVLVLAVVLGLDRRITAALGAVAALTIATFLWHFELGTDDRSTEPVGLAHFVLVYLGSIVWGGGSRLAALVGAAGLILFAVVCVLAWRERAGRSIAVPTGAGVAAFIVSTAALTSVGRLSLGVDQALSSRYSIAAATFWLGLLVGLLPWVIECTRSQPIVAPAFLGVAGLAFVGVGFRQLPVDTYLPTLVLGRELTVAAYLSGVEDRSQLTPSGQGGDGVRPALAWMERHDLGPWAPGGLAKELVTAHSVTPTTRPCRGRIEQTVQTYGGTRNSGWIDTDREEPASRHLVVLNGSAAPVGYGLVGAYRPDARPAGARDARRGFVAYAPGEPRDIAVLLLDVDGVTAVCGLRGSPAR